MPIGFPVDNTSVYLFDDDMRPVGLEKVPFDEWMLPTSFTRAGFVSFTSSGRMNHDFGVVKRLLLGIKRQLWKNMTRNTHLNYKTLLGVARSSVQFEVSPSQEGLPKQVAQGVGSSLLRPPPLKQESIIPPLGHSGYRRYLYHQGNEQTTGGTAEAAAKPWLIPAGKYFAAHRPQGQHPP